MPELIDPRLLVKPSSGEGVWIGKTRRARRPSGGQERNFPVGLVQIPFLDRASLVDDSRDVEVCILQVVVPLVKASIGRGRCITVSQDEIVDVAQAPSPALLYSRTTWLTTFLLPNRTAFEWEYHE